MKDYFNKKIEKQNSWHEPPLCIEKNVEFNEIDTYSELLDKLDE